MLVLLKKDIEVPILFMSKEQILKQVRENIDLHI